jgi:uncharacterized phage protein (TIGR01671 family)
MKDNNMNNIKFRGKRIEYGEWIYGTVLNNKPIWDNRLKSLYVMILNDEYDLESAINYLKDPLGYEHLKDSVGKVLVESIGRYSGYKDKDGKEIYEGDIINEGTFVGAVRLGEFCIEFESDSYSTTEDVTGWHLFFETDGRCPWTCALNNCKLYTIIGNIYETEGRCNIQRTY